MQSDERFAIYAWKPGQRPVHERELTQPAMFPRLSVDDRQVAVTVFRQDSDVWVLDGL